MFKEAYKNLDEFKSALENEGSAALNKIYTLYKDEFFSFCKKFNIADDLIADIYQDSIIAFYENVVQGKLVELKSSLKTYIFSIGKYSIYNLQKKENKTVSMEDEHLRDFDLSMIKEDDEIDPRIAIMREALNSMGENCRKILMLFYYQSYTIETLMIELDYKNENTVRAHKSRCLKSLKNAISKK